MSKYILLIMNCEKYLHKRENQKSTWLQYLPNTILYFHVIGRNIDVEKDKDYIIDHSNNMLYVNTPDDYNSLPQKVISAFDAINKEYKGQYEYIFKTDDDQVNATDNIGLFFENLINILEKRAEEISDKIHYGGFIVDVKFDHVSKYYTIHKELPTNLIVERGKYCNGRFYLLSKESITDLVTKKEQFKKEYFEDYSMGKYLNPSLKEKILFIDSSKIFKDMPNNIIL